MSALLLVVAIAAVVAIMRIKYKRVVHIQDTIETAPDAHSQSINLSCFITRKTDRWRGRRVTVVGREIETSLQHDTRKGKRK